MGIFSKRPEITLPKIGEVVWVHHLESDKLRPYLVINKYKASSKWNIVGIYLTTQQSQYTYHIEDDTYADPRRVKEFSILSVHQKEGMIPEHAYRSIIKLVKNQFKYQKYGK